MKTLVLRNLGSETLQVQDLGIYLRTGEEIDLILSFRNEDILESNDIESAILGDGAVFIVEPGEDDIELSYADVIKYLTSLTRYDKIDYSYISSKDEDTNITGAQLEALIDGSDVAGHHHDTRYYTKTQLQTGGQADISWDNISNAPQFGSVHWKDPVDRTDTSYGSGTTLPLTDNEVNDARMVEDDGDGKPAQYVCVATEGPWNEQWKKIADVDWGHANSIKVDPLGNLTSNKVQAALYELQGDIDGIVAGTIDILYSLDDAYQDGSIVDVNDTDVEWRLGASREFKITNAAGSSDYLSITNGAVAVSTTAFTLSGTTASSVNVTGGSLTLSTTTSGNLNITSAAALMFKDANLTNAISISESGVAGLDAGFTATSIVGALNELMTGGGAANTLDDAYNGATGNGSGRTITVDNGSVKLDATSASYAPLELTQQASAPTADLAAGQISFINGQLYAYDGGRTKWLSVNELVYTWSDKNAKGKYLPVGNALDSGMGFRMPQNATVTKLTVWSSNGQNRELEIRRNGASTSLKTFSLVSGTYTSTNDNIDLAAGDVLQVYVSGGSGPPAQDIIVTAYIRWRP